MNAKNNAKNIADIYPLSPMQQGILFHSLLSPEAGIYMPQVCLTLSGNLDVARFQQAWQQIVDYYTSLRTAFYWEQRDQPFQVVYRQVKLPWDYQDWRSHSNETQSQRLAEFLACDRQQGFSLTTPPLMRITLIRLAEQQYHLVWTQHHLILDGWSAALVLKDMWMTYRSLQQNTLPALQGRPYADYIAWLQNQDLAAARQYWQERLRSFTTPTVLPIDTIQSSLMSPSDEDSSPVWQEQQLLFHGSLTTDLKSFASQHQLTLNTVIQGAIALLLSRYCDTSDVVFGSTFSGRPASLTGAASMVGLFINTLPVRVQVPEQTKLISWLQQLQTQQAEALQYEYTPLSEIQNWSDLPQGTSLFETLLVFENYPIDSSLLEANANLRIRQVRSIEWTHLPLTILVTAATELSITAKFDRHRFTPDSITRLLEQIQTLLKNITTNPDQPLRELTLLTPAEQQQQIVEWNSTQADYPHHYCLHELFEIQVEQTPDAIALVYNDDHLTYAELNTRANQLAHYLQSSGIQPDDLVGICIDRSLEMIIAILAVLKAGAAYLPLDPTYPQERLDFMLKDAQVQVVLTNRPAAEQGSGGVRETGDLKHLIPHSPFPYSQTINLTTDWRAIAPYPTANPASAVTPAHPVYVIYTSGSTGTPKGVINLHRALVNRLTWMQKAYTLTEADRVLHKTPFSFDVSVWEFFWTLLNGACLVIAQPDGHWDSTYLEKIITEQQITTLHFVPSMLRVFLEEAHGAACRSLQRIICSGEALPAELQNRCLTHFNARLYNLYGPTEAAIDVSAHECQLQTNAVTVPIGKPIDNLQLYILDRYLRPVPVGVPGELHISGDGLARGYLHRPDLTAEKFIPNPFGQPDKKIIDPTTPPPSPLTLYKTGDRVRYRPDGTIEFLNRIDDQVKLRGFRIELGEIEALLAQHPQVQQAIVTLRTDSPDPQLVAYVVPQPEMRSQSSAVSRPAPYAHPPTSLSPADLRQFLADRLPAFMIPSTFVQLVSFPLTANGKLNRRALPALDRTPNRTPIAPRNPTEAIVAAIWQEVLKLENLGVEDNFFELGGNSLLATRITSRLRTAFQLDLPLRSLFEKPTIAQLAQRIQTMQTTLQQLHNPSTPAQGRKEIEL